MDMSTIARGPQGAMTDLLDADTLLASDREHLWHPYTSMTAPTPTRVVTGADGVRLRLGDGRDVVDGMSSWWAAIHGYRHPALDAAAHAQLDDFAHVMFGGLTHAPAVRLAERLVEVTPDGLDHVFLADSGSVSVEVAIKMVLQFQRGTGRPERTRLLTVRGGYHGDTFGCMSVCDPVGGMHSMFTEVLPRHVFADRPPTDPEASPVYAELVSAEHQAARLEKWEADFRETAAAHAHELAGIIVEPLLQGAGGMHAYPASCLRVMREVADEHGLLLVLDEIATGFGRTGTMFAADGAGVRPDVLCVGKALTGGYLTLAAVLCSGDVARGIAGSESGVLMHGPTYMGNPLACAVALANPLSADLGVMRTALLPGLVDALARNRARQQNRVRLFELGKVFHRVDGAAPRWMASAISQNATSGSTTTSGQGSRDVDTGVTSGSGRSCWTIPARAPSTT